MKLSFDIIFDALAEKYKLSRVGHPGTAADIAAPLFYAGDAQPGYIYIADGQIPGEGCRAAVICGADAANKLAADTAAIIIEQDFAPRELMNTIIEIFNDHAQWDEALRKTVEARKDMRALVEQGMKKIACRLLVSTKDLLLLADSKYVGENAPDAADYQGQTLPNDVVKKISQDIRRKTPMQGGYLLGQDGRYEGRMVYNLDMYIGGRYEGICSLMENERPFRESDIALFKHFYKYAYELFLFYYGTKGKSRKALRTVMAELLAQRNVSAALSAETEQYAAEFENYRCVVIGAGEGAELPGEYLIKMLESAHEGCVALLHKGRVAAFLPQLDEKQRDSLREQITRLGFFAGCSAPGGGIMNCRALYMQAVSTLRIGSRHGKGRAWYQFEDNMLEYLLRNSGGTLPRDMLQTPGMKRLIEYDAGSEVDYINTLKVYLDNEMSATQSANKLFLHRSSFLKRMERIEQLLGDELATPRGRLLLRWQLYTLEYEAERE